MQNYYLYIAAFISGFMGSMHCFGMCGGLVSIFSLNLQNAGQNTRLKQLEFALSYNLARIFSYSMVGFIAGSFSFFISHQLPFSFFYSLQIVASFILLMIACNILGWKANIFIPERIVSTLWVRLQILSRSFLPIDSILKSFLFGLLWGWLPCGLVYSVLLIAVTTAHALEAALIMFAFGLGTLPAMLSLSYFSLYAKNFFQHPLLRYVCATVLIVIAAIPFMHFSKHDHDTHTHQQIQKNHHHLEHH